MEWNGDSRTWNGDMKPRWNGGDEMGTMKIGWNGMRTVEA